MSRKELAFNVRVVQLIQKREILVTVLSMLKSLDIRDESVSEAIKNIEVSRMCVVDELLFNRVEIADGLEFLRQRNIK